MKSALVYVHFPWCLAKCPYCDFVSYGVDRDALPHDAYADAVIRELDGRAAALSGRFDDREVTSVFFGGGTPSLWAASAIGRVLSAIRDRLDVCAECEVTVECNPTSLDHERASALFDAGVNRLSIGTQSLRQDQLRFLGRLHDPSGARAAISGALASPITRISTDMIFGLPDQAPDDARDQACALADLGLTHLSCYQLTIEPGTPFGERAKRGRLPLADDGAVADAFLAIDESLCLRGFEHYEISNYAMPNERSRHNVGYWQGREYVGLGCAAYGFVRGRFCSPASEAIGVRYRNAIDPKRYMLQVESIRTDRIGADDGVSLSSEELGAETLLRERIMLGLRLVEGVDLDACARDLSIDPWTAERSAAIENLVAKGRLEASGTSIRIPKRAWLWSDDTAARLF